MMMRGVVVWVMLMGVTVSCAAQVVNAPVAAQTVAGPQSSGGTDGQSTSADQQANGQVPAQVAPAVVSAARKTHRVRKVIVTSLFVGALVLSGMGGAFHD